MNGFIEELKQEVLNYPVMSHPFWSRFREGHLTWKHLGLMKTAKAGVLLFIIFIACSACAALVNGRSPPGENEPRRSAYLVSHGWHTGIVIQRDDIPAGIWPESGDFPDSEYLEIGWGDRDYYQAPGFNVWYAFKAVLWPTASVLHVVGFSDPPQRYFPQSEIVELQLSQSGYERLIDYIHSSFARGDAEKSVPLRPGLYGKSAFYPSHEKFHLFKTCNVWTARALRAAGYPLIPFFAVTSDQVMSRARRHGKVIPLDAAGQKNGKDAWLFALL